MYIFQYLEIYSQIYLAILINSNQKWLNTEDFLEALKENLEDKLKN